MIKKINICLILIITFIFSISKISSAQEFEEKKATPQRPTFSKNAFTTFPGAFELESGIGLSDEQFDTQLMIKYGAGLNVDLFIILNPYLRLRNPEILETEFFETGVAEGLGDTYIGGKYRFWMDFYEEKRLAVQLHVKVPTAKEIEYIPIGGLGTGETDFTGLFIYTDATEKYQLDLNFGLTLAGKYWESGLERQSFGTVCFTRNLTRKFSIFGELYGYERWEPKVDYMKEWAFIGLFGLSYALKPTAVFDISSNFGLKNVDYNWQIGTGLTVTL